MRQNYVIGIIILVISLIILIASSILFINYFSAGGMYGMIGHMMSMSYMLPMSYLWIIMFLSIIGVIIGFAFILYYFMTPQTITNKEGDLELSRDSTKTINDLLRVLKPDEKRVVELLIENNGKMLQKEIRWSLGYTRLKTHRIIEGLVERNIVKRRKVGSTNEIILSEWIMERLGD